MIQKKALVTAAGPHIKKLYKDITTKSLPLRFWRDHLLILPRITRDNVFQVRKGQGMLFNHRSKSIFVGLRGEVQTPELDNSVNEEQLAKVIDSAKNLFHSFDKWEYKPYASTKIDLGVSGNRSVSEFIINYSNFIIFAAPGKMTAAPVVADKIINQLF